MTVEEMKKCKTCGEIKTTDNFYKRECGLRNSCKTCKKIGGKKYRDANDIDNLITLCKECHSETHQKESCKTTDLRQVSCFLETAIMEIA